MLVPFVPRRAALDGDCMAEHIEVHRVPSRLSPPSAAGPPPGPMWSCSGYGEPGCDSGGCSTAAPVIAFNLVAFLVGLALWSRRERRPRGRS